MKPRQYAIGIDISSKDFAVCVSTEPGIALHGSKMFANNIEGFNKLHAWFMALKIKPKDAAICMEATGVYGERLCYFLNEHKYAVVVEPPLKVKRAFKVDGHKTDAADSLQIAEYALRFYDELNLWEPREDIVEKMKALITTRELLVKQKTAASNSLKALNRKVVKSVVAIKALKDNIKMFTRRIKALEKEMDNLIDKKPAIKQTVNILRSTPGVQSLMAVNMLVVTNGFTSEKHHKQLASYLKIAPLQYQSGTSVLKKPRAPKYGPSIMRKLLHLAARSAVTHNPTFKKYYLRKQAEGKAKMLVLNNVENKLIKIMCAMIRDQKPYIENYHSINPNFLKMA